METLGDLMTTDPITIGPDDPLDVALSRMIGGRFRHLPVVDPEGGVVGVLTLGDILDAGLSSVGTTADEHARHLRGVRVRQALHGSVVTASPVVPWRDAAASLARHRCSSLPVVDGGRLVGIVTRTDLVAFVLDAYRGVPVVRLMSTPALRTSPTETLDVAAAVMRGRALHHLPVVDGGRVIGMLSWHDLLGAFGAGTARLSSVDRIIEEHRLHVRDAMTAPAITASPDDDAAATGTILLQRKIGALPIVRKGHLVGVLSGRDFLDHYDAIAATPSTNAS
jgi:CBS domain-containing protein